LAVNTHQKCVTETEEKIMLRSLMLSAVLGLSSVGLVAVTPSDVDARPHYHARHYRNYARYYGFGGHDAVPHWHRTYTPFGSLTWYGRGAHDYRPHLHTYGAYGYRGYSPTPFGPTVNYYPPYPYYYAPW
jgi:hypothetical protein